MCLAIGALALASFGCGSTPSAMPGPISPQAKPAAGPDAEVIVMLDAVHASGRAEDDRVLDGLPVALRGELTRVAGTVSAEDKKRLATDPATVKMRPLLAAATLPEADATLHAICCARTMARELLGAYARPTDAKPMLASAVREVRRRAAIRYVRRVRSSLAAGTHLDAAGADALREVADALGHAGLRRAAAERALALEPTTTRRGAATAAAASAFRVDDARAHLDKLRGVPFATRLLDAYASDVEDASQFLKAGGEKATGDAALEAALRAARLGRLDVAQALLDRTKVPYPSDLRAAAARAVIVYGRDLDVGLGTGDAATHAAFQNGDPVLAKVRDDLDAAFASKKGRTPESLDVLMGAIVLVSVDSLGSDSASQNVFERLVVRFRRLRDIASLPEMPASPRRDAVVLAVDAQLAAYENLLTKGEEGLAVPTAARAALIDRATRLVEASPASSSVAHAALAVAIALQWGTKDDTLPLFDKLTKTPRDTSLALDDLEPTRVLLEEWVSLSHDHGDRLEKVRLRLEKIAASRTGRDAWRLGMHARSLALRTTAPDIEKAYAPLVALCAVDKMPADADADDHLEAAMARAGVLWRMGRIDESQKAYDSAVDARITSQGATPPVVAAFELFGTVLRGKSKEPAARRKAIAELERRRATLESAELSAYADTWIVGLAAAPDVCEKKDAACRTEVAAAAKSAKTRLVDGPKPGSARGEGIARGIVSIAGSAHAGIGYSTREGVILNPFVTSRLAVLPPTSQLPPR